MQTLEQTADHFESMLEMAETGEFQYDSQRRLGVTVNPHYFDHFSAARAVALFANSIQPFAKEQPDEQSAFTFDDIVNDYVKTHKIDSFQAPRMPLHSTLEIATKAGLLVAEAQFDETKPTERKFWLTPRGAELKPWGCIDVSTMVDSASGVAIGFGAGLMGALITNMMLFQHGSLSTRIPSYIANTGGMLVAGSATGQKVAEFKAARYAYKEQQRIGYSMQETQ